MCLCRRSLHQKTLKIGGLLDVRAARRSYHSSFTRDRSWLGVLSSSIRDRPTAPRSPWQNGYCERAIGSIRRDCLDHIVVFEERHLRHLLRSYAAYYNQARTHLSLGKDVPLSRPVHATGRKFDFPTGTPNQKAVKTRRKCPLENNKTLPETLRTRATMRSARSPT